MSSNRFMDAVSDVVSGIATRDDAERRTSGLYKDLDAELKASGLSSLLRRLDLFHGNITLTSVVVLKDNGYTVNNEAYDFLRNFYPYIHEQTEAFRRAEGRGGCVDKAYAIAVADFKHYLDVKA